MGWLVTTEIKGHFIVLTKLVSKRLDRNCTICGKLQTFLNKSPSLWTTFELAERHRSSILVLRSGEYRSNVPRDKKTLHYHLLSQTS